MTTNSRENPSPATTPSKSTGDTLLKAFRTTLDARWNEFDRATMEEAEGQTIMGVGARTGRDNHPDFIKAKEAFDTAKAMLTKVSNDTELKESTQILTQVETTLKSLTDHLKALKPDEKGKKMNIILARTTADLASFKASITGKEADKKEAEVASAAEKAIPRAAVAVAAAGTAGVISSAEARDLATEGTKEIKKGIKGAIAEFLGFDKKRMIEDMAKKAKGESIGFMGTIRVMIFSLLSRFEFLGMTDDWTPEELRLAGLKGALPQASATPTASEKPKEVAKDKYDGSRWVFEKLLLDNTENLPYTNILTAVKMKGSTMGELKNVHTNKSHEAFLKTIEIPVDAKSKKGMEQILATLFDGNKAKYILESYNSAKGLKKKSPSPESETFGNYIIAAGAILKKMGGIAKASITHKMPDASVRYDDSNEEVAFSGSEDQEEILKLFGGDKKLLAYMLGYDANFTVKMSDVDKPISSTTLSTRYPDPTEKQKAQETLKKVMNFGKDFMTQVISNPDIHLGMKDELQQIMNERAFKLKGYALIYITLAGKSVKNFSDFSTIEQAQVYGMVMTLLQTEESNYKKGQLTSRYLTALNNAKGEIPGGVKNFFADATVYAGVKGMSVLSEGAKYIAGLATENKSLAAIFTALNIPWIPTRSAVADYF